MREEINANTGEVSLPHQEEPTDNTTTSRSNDHPRHDSKEPVASNTDNNDNNNNRKWMLLLGGVLILVFMAALGGAIIGYAVANKHNLGGTSDSHSEPSNANAEMVSSSSDPSSNNGDADAIFDTKEELDSFLVESFPGSAPALEDPTSSQSQALDWLWEDIPLLDSIGASQILTRYALAVFYFATNGPGWTLSKSFLSHTSECEWPISDGYIPTSYGELSNLSEDWISPCNDKGDLQALSIASNDLLGTIPAEIGLLSQLEFFSLRDATLTGTIPTHVGQWSLLRFFTITQTLVTGQIPTELGALAFLDILDVSYNDLSGTLPTEWGQLSALDWLTVHQNPKIRGTVPEEWGQLKSAKQISFSVTAVTGTVPESVCNIRAGRVGIGSVCDQSQLLCCCCTGCCRENSCVGYGGGNICENEWYPECEACGVEPPF